MPTTMNLMPATNRFELQIANELEQLRRMSEWLSVAAESLELSDTLAWNLDLCANEAVANIILYGYEDQRQGQIALRLELKANEAVCLSIEDDGKAFNPFTVLPPAPYDTIENAPIGGLGVHLIRSLMDDCHYRRSDDKNIITLCSRLNQASASASSNGNCSVA
jgi:anti-sigma regulatory factor (Ser/Thr protein kinase)